MVKSSSSKLINEYLYENESKLADLVYLRQPIKGKWREYTWKETMRQARIMTTFLKSLGLKRGDRVAVMSKNCAEWFISDFAIAMGGFISVPLFPSQAADVNRFILEHSESKVVFVGKLDNPELQEQAIASHLPRISFGYDGGMSANYEWADIIRDYQPDFDNLVPDPKDFYTIAYTSGTTGSPKGAMISHGAYANRVKAFTVDPAVPQVDHFNLISYLPLAHIYERAFIEGLSLIFKSTVSFVESIETFARDLREISPSVFQSVPRLWAQFQKGIFEKIPEKRLRWLLKIPFVNTLIKKKIKAGLGFSRCELFVSGSAPISTSLIHWYKNIGIEIIEGYGRTEDLAFVSAGKPGQNVVGTVGKIQAGVEYRIGENNELLTRSNCMMSGYYKNEEATREAFTEDGFLRTGDEVTIDENGYLRILGRVKDTFKTDKGEFVNPVPIESEFASNHHIEQLCLIGLQLPQPVMLVVLSAAAKLRPKDEITKSLSDTVHAANVHLSKYEKIAGIIVCKTPWTPDNGFLTPTLKMRRNVIHKRYIDLARNVGASKDLIFWET